MALTRVVSEIFNIEKYHNLEIPVKSQSRSLKAVPFDRLGMVSYSCSIVTLSVRHSVFKIFDFKNAMILKTGLRVHEGH